MPSLTSAPPRPRATSPGLYQSDLYTWAKQQAEALRRRDPGAIDWENVIEEIEGLASEQKTRWVSHCARALEHLLAIERWQSASPGTLRKWEKEIRAFRRGMARALDTNLGLQGEYGEMLTLAWQAARPEAVERLAEYSAAEAGAEEDWPYRKAWRAKLPEDCPYLVEDVAAYDPKRDKEPREDVWPPAVAVRLNTVLGRDYKIRRAPRRAQSWSR